MQGEKGENGPPGPEQAGILDDQYRNCTWCWRMLNPYLILALVLWLILVTLLLVVTIAIVTCRRRQPEHLGHNLKWSSSHNDLWKHYEDDRASKPGYDNPALEPTYSTVQEGRTAF
jgi:hypothetical protein